MHRSFSTCAAAAAGLLAALGFACGDLVIPQNNSADDGGDPVGDDDGGSSGDDATLDPLPAVDCDAGVTPVALACTGLYADWTSLALAPDVQAYTPGATMWVDGADGSRWIWLPPGAKIDTSNPNGWVFPVGTKVWQELRVLGKRMETRYEQKLDAQNWFRTTFAWNDAQTAAPALTTGRLNARGLPYEIPSVGECGQCHGGARDFVLGFEHVSLGLPQAAGLNLSALAQQGRLSAPPSAMPRIPGDPGTIAAFSFLHANCGTSCHNRNAGAMGGATGLFLALRADTSGALPATPQQTDTWTTSYEVPSALTPYGADAGGFWRLAPGDVLHSALAWTASRRDGVAQMPPIATHLVDQNDVNALDAWIAGLQR